jgi:hypothetical protein
LAAAGTAVDAGIDRRPADSRELTVYNVMNAPSNAASISASPPTSTLRYLGIEVDDVLAIAEQIEV